MIKENNLDTSLSVRISGEAHDALAKIAVESKVPISALIREYLSDVITKTDYSYLDDYKLSMEIESTKRFHKAIHQKVTQGQRTLKKLCYMLIENDPYEKILWWLERQLDREFYFKSDFEILIVLRDYFVGKQSIDIHLLLSNHINFDMLRLRNKRELEIYTTPSAIILDNLKRMLD